MKRIVRQCVFESNSSSTHAICICTDKWYLDYEIPETLYFGIGEHGWEFKTLSTPEEKANYLYTGILYKYGKIEGQKYIDKIFKMLGDKGCEAEFEEPEWRDWGNGEFHLYNGYVDHVGELEEFINALFKRSHMLLDYLFSDKSFVIKGNDNSSDDERRALDFKVDYDYEEFYKGN